MPDKRPVSKTQKSLPWEKFLPGVWQGKWIQGGRGRQERWQVVGGGLQEAGGGGVSREGLRVSGRFYWQRKERVQRPWGEDTRKALDGVEARMTWSLTRATVRGLEGRSPVGPGANRCSLAWAEAVYGEGLPGPSFCNSMWMTPIDNGQKGSGSGVGFVFCFNSVWDVKCSFKRTSFELKK